MKSILDDIVAKKIQEVAEACARTPERELERKLENCKPALDFRKALEVPGRISIIAEVKKASPSAGILREDFDPVQIAKIYEANGAACISVLTDEAYFRGSLDYLARIRGAVKIPLLRKDFIIDRYQLLEARLAGADAVLLIAEILNDMQLSSLLAEAENLGMQALVELYDPENLSRVLNAGARLVGINNRNLHTFVTKLEHTIDLALRVPADCCLVSESGICSRADLERLRDSGVKAVLIGETFMRAPDIGAKLRELLGTP